MMRIVFCGVIITLSCLAGGKEGTGGDIYSQEFTEIAREIADQLAQNKMILTGVQPEIFKHAVETLKVVTVESLDASEEEAIAYPQENKVELSRSRWREYQANPQGKRLLVLHEMLILIGVGDEHYQVSNDYIDQVKRRYESPERESAKDIYQWSVAPSFLPTKEFWIGRCEYPGNVQIPVVLFFPEGHFEEGKGNFSVQSLAQNRDPESFSYGELESAFSWIDNSEQKAFLDKPKNTWQKKQSFLLYHTRQILSLRRFQSIKQGWYLVQIDNYQDPGDAFTQGFCRFFIRVPPPQLEPSANVAISGGALTSVSTQVFKDSPDFP